MSVAPICNLFELFEQTHKTHNSLEDLTKSILLNKDK